MKATERERIYRKLEISLALLDQNLLPKFVLTSLNTQHIHPCRTSSYLYLYAGTSFMLMQATIFLSFHAHQHKFDRIISMLPKADKQVAAGRVRVNPDAVLLIYRREGGCLGRNYLLIS